VNEASNEVLYSRNYDIDEWYPQGGDTTNPVKWPKVEPLKNRKERLAVKAMRRKLEKHLARQRAK
jgi:hypothetical protein